MLLSITITLVLMIAVTAFFADLWSYDLEFSDFLELEVWGALAILALNGLVVGIQLGFPIAIIELLYRIALKL